MKNLKTLKRISALTLATAILSSTALAVNDIDEIEEELIKTAQTVTSYGSSAVQYAVWYEGEIIASGTDGVYSKTQNTALTDSHLFGIGSVSKMYTTAAILLLEDEGKVSLDTPVVEYLPEFKMLDERYKDITVRMLLNHSSGLMGSTFTNAMLYDDAFETDSTKYLLARLSMQRLQADPGAYSVYCNDGFTLAELIIERISGLSYTEFLAENITEPLDLKSTFTPRDSFNEDRLVKTYLGDGMEENQTETLTVIGAGGIYSTAKDLATFGGSFTNDELLLLETDQLTMEKEYKNGISPDDADGSSIEFGLGWDGVNVYPFNENDIQALVKGGDTINYHASLMVLPEYELSVAVLTSGGSSVLNQSAAATMAMTVLEAEGVVVEETGGLSEFVPTTMPEAYKDFAGMYGSSFEVLNISFEDNKLILKSHLSPQASEYTYSSDGSFRDAANKTQITPIVEENGNTYLYFKSYSNIDEMANIYTSAYLYQKMPQNILTEEVAGKWAEREGKAYALINEKYTSMSYPLGGTFAGVSTVGTEGYLLTNKIIDENTAIPILQIPGTGSRDMTEYAFYQRNEVEHMQIGGNVYIDMSTLDYIYIGESTCTISDTGEARWFYSGEDEGMSMTVNVPSEAAFYVYNSSLIPVGGSSEVGEATVEVPVGGVMVFVGEKGVKFEISVTE